MQPEGGHLLHSKLECYKIHLPSLFESRYKLKFRDRTLAIHPALQSRYEKKTCSGLYRDI